MVEVMQQTGIPSTVKTKEEEKQPEKRCPPIHSERGSINRTMAKRRRC